MRVFEEAATRGALWKQVFLEISQNSQENNFLKKETLAQVFYCEFCEISKKAFFTEHLWTTASGFGIVLRKMLELEYLKLELTQYRFENLPICLHSYENNTLNISHS